MAKRKQPGQKRVAAKPAKARMARATLKTRSSTPATSPERMAVRTLTKGLGDLVQRVVALEQLSPEGTPVARRELTGRITALEHNMEQSIKDLRGRVNANDNDLVKRVKELEAIIESQPWGGEPE